MVTSCLSDSMPPIGGPRQPPQLEPDERPLERRFGDAFQGLIVLGLAGIFGLLLNLSQDSAVIKSQIQTMSRNDLNQDNEIKLLKSDVERIKVALQVERELRRSR
jgi:hypothetical protein